MATLRTIKQRIRSVKNIRQMTRAMEAVAANKMRRSQAVALSARPYAEKALEILANLEKSGVGSIHPLLARHESQKKLVVLITSDKGLCGSLNSIVMNKLQKLLSGGGEYEFIALGQHGAKKLAKQKKAVLETRKGIGEIARLEDARPVARAIMQKYIEGEYSDVIMVYANFISVLKQEAVSRTILPVSRAMLEEIIKGIGGMKGVDHRVLKEYVLPSGVEWHWEYQFEPSTKEILDEILPALVEVAIYHMIIEANASEHSARMVAMKSASDNANDLLGDLVLNYNKARQSSITQELLEITSGKEALRENL